ncbi:MAG: hypothetical protein U5L45_06755 [Saprospiraceae bacterium]|nr:hypothetical protein [Saprospiraceae bacterium]
MVHFSASPKNEPHSLPLRKRRERVIKSYKNIEPDSINMKNY